MACLTLAVLSPGQPPPQSPPSSVPIARMMPLTIVKAQGVRQLPQETLAKNLPVRLTGIVTYYNPVIRDLFIQDETAGIYVGVLDIPGDFKPGDRVNVKGVTDRGDFAPCLKNAKVEKIGTGPIPSPVPFDLTVTDSRWLDGQWVIVQATGEQIARSNGKSILTIHTSRGTGTVILPDAEGRTPLSLFDGKPIRVRAVCVPKIDLEKRIVKGPARLFISSIEQIELIPTFPLRDEVTGHLEDLFRRFVPTPYQGSREVKVEGIVTGVRDQVLFFQDGPLGASAACATPTSAKPGDRVRVTGQLKIVGEWMHLSQGTVSVLGTGTLPEPVNASLEEMTSGIRHGMRVRMEGRVKEYSNNAFEQPTVIVDVGPLRAMVTIGHDPDVLLKLPAGSKVILTGTYYCDQNMKSHQTIGFLLNDESDIESITVPRRYRLWTDPKALTFFAGVAFVIFGGTAWVLILRRTIRRQTEDLRKTALHEQELAEKLRQSQKMEAIGRLAGGIAHDFNNLLTVINGSAELLPEMLPDNDPAREMASDIRSAGEKAAGLVAQLLTFSRQRPAQLSPLDLNHVVEEAEKFLRRLLGEDLLLVIAKGYGLPPILGEPILLHQVLINLAVNARDAMPVGGRLTISTGASERGAQLKVIDTGCGMSPEVLEKLFEPFFTTKEVGKGTGLGLATVYGIVQTLGGEIRVHSTIGRGTTFEIDFPRAPEQAAMVETPGPLTLRRMQASIAKTTILLVEDDDAVRALTSRVLERDGYRVLAAETPSMAFGILATDHVDILITDVVMPGMGGRELAQKVREIVAGIQVLYMSGYTADEVLKRGILEDEVNFLNKPFTNAQLSERVAELVNRAETRPSKSKLPTTRDVPESVVCY